MTESSEDLAAVEQLLAEGDALRGWLARLDRAPGSAPDTVRDRVRRDYQGRLDQITAGLRAHADVIESKLTEDRAERSDLESRALAAREALAEAELRHAVGEFDADRVDNERRRHGSDIETFQLSLDAVGERIGRLEEIQSVVHRPPLELAIEPEPAAATVEVTDAPAAAAEVVEPPPVAIADLAPDPEVTLAIFDEPVAEVVEVIEPESSVAPMPLSGPLSFRPTGFEMPRQVVAPPARPRPFESAPPLGIPTADLPPKFIRPGERLVAHPAPPVAPPARGLGSGAVAPGGNGAAAGTAPEATASPVGRTLRCGECGAMNRPLEWYCEKCGAELTAV